jgi:conjugal transfer ATP-binding protein TraC
MTTIDGIDLFNSNVNYNACVMGEGEGKLSLLKRFASSYAAKGNKVFILDLSGAYKKLCEECRGEYVEISVDEPFSLNPFSEIDGEKTLQEELEYLTDFCYGLGYGANEYRRPFDEKFLKSYLSDSIRRVYNEKGSNAEVTDVQRKMSELAKTEQDAHCKDFARQMSIYCKGGIYEKFFARKNELNLRGDFIVFNVQQIEGYANLRDPIIMALFYRLCQKAYKNNNATQRFIAIIDEAHRFLTDNPRMDDVIDQTYRWFRKAKSSFTIAMRGFDAFYKKAQWNGLGVITYGGQLSRAGAAIVNSSAWKFFVKQTETSVNLLIKFGIFDLSKREEEILLSIAKSEYGEIFMITPDNLKTQVSDRYSYYLNTSDQNDKRKTLEAMATRGATINEAIRTLIAKERALGSTESIAKEESNNARR